MNKINVLLFGITGRTGKLIAEQLLANEYKVTAIARKPEMVRIKHPDLQIVEGDILNSSSYSDHIKYCDAVLSAVGESSTQPTNLYSSGIECVLKEMQIAGRDRLICISACPVEIGAEVAFWLRWLMKYVIQKIFKNGYADMRIMEQRLKASGTNWTIVRPPMLTNKPARHKYKIAINGHLRTPFSISRTDLANYMAGIIENAETFHSTVEIAY